MAKKQSNTWAKVGVWSYIVGLVIALILSFWQMQTWVVGVLVALGVIVGLLNIADGEVQMFLVASVAFIIAALALEPVFSGMAFPFWAWLGRLMGAIVVFTAPGALVVAFKALYHVAK